MRVCTPRQVSAPLHLIVKDGLEKRDHDAWFDLTGRHRDGLQVSGSRLSAELGKAYSVQS